MSALALLSGCSTQFELSRGKRSNLLGDLGSMDLPGENPRIGYSDQHAYAVSGKCTQPGTTIRVAVLGTASVHQTQCNPPAMGGAEPAWATTVNTTDAPDGPVGIEAFQVSGTSQMSLGKIEVPKFTRYCTQHFHDPLPSGAGTYENPYRICAPHQFQTIGRENMNQPNKVFVLVNNLDFSSAQNYKPVENFKAALFGSGFSIRNLRIRYAPSQADPNLWIDGSVLPRAYGLFGKGFAGLINPVAFLSLHPEFTFPVSDIASNLLFISIVEIDSVAQPSIDLPTGLVAGQMINGGYVAGVISNSIRIRGRSAVGGLLGEMRAGTGSPGLSPVLFGNRQTRIKVTATVSKAGGSVGQLVTTPNAIPPLVSFVQIVHAEIESPTIAGGIVGSNQGVVNYSSITNGVLNAPSSEPPVTGSTMGCGAGANLGGGSLTNLELQCNAGLGDYGQSSVRPVTRFGGITGENSGEVSRNSVKSGAAVIEHSGGAVGVMLGGMLLDNANQLSNLQGYSHTPNGTTPSLTQSGLGGFVGLYEGGSIERNHSRTLVSSWVSTMAFSTNQGFFGLVGPSASTLLSTSPLTINGNYVHMGPLPEFSNNSTSTGHGTLEGMEHPIGGVRTLTPSESLDASSYVFQTLEGQPAHWTMGGQFHSLACDPNQTQAVSPWTFPPTGTLPSLPTPSMAIVCPPL